ncbi:hypothetical protein CHUAL_013650 [Chamberlinius hualienensis]
MQSMAYEGVSMWDLKRHRALVFKTANLRLINSEHENFIVDVGVGAVLEPFADPEPVANPYPLVLSSPPCKIQSTLFIIVCGSNSFTYRNFHYFRCSASRISDVMVCVVAKNGFTKSASSRPIPIEAASNIWFTNGTHRSETVAGFINKKRVHIIKKLNWEINIQPAPP